jgi:DNA ligase-associated metallophosphoesterase
MERSLASAIGIDIGEGASRCRVELLPGRAAMLPESRTLLVADLHLGKAATFRKAGLPVPEGAAQQDLARLLGLVEATGARRLVILGDLFHAASGCTTTVLDEFRMFREGIAAIETVLVLGNHDRRVRLPASLGLDLVVPELVEGHVRFIHDPGDAVEPNERHESLDRRAADRRVTFCGHLHPRLAIRSPSGGRLTERCFVESDGCFVLPAFGSFTGTHAVEPAAGMRLFAAGLDAVVDVTRMALLAAG